MTWSSALPLVLLLCGLSGAAGCRRDAAVQPPSRARHAVLITVDTLRPDRIGAYGYANARTPVFDALARTGTRFDRASATSPITLTSHASLMSGRYPPGHGARHNGLRVRDDVPLLAEAFARRGFRTGAFVGAFPLDRRFGLQRGFDVYGDRMPRAGGAQPRRRQQRRARAARRTGGSSGQ